MISVEVLKNRTEWDEIVLDLGGHPLQLSGWGRLKAAHNWQVERVVVKDEGRLIGAAQILIRRLPWPFKSMLYVPRGPVSLEADRAAVLRALASYAKRSHKAVVLTIEPDWADMPTGTDWRASSNTILIGRTLILDLRQSEEELLAAMSKKTRQYIRKSTREDAVIRQVKSHDELKACLEIYRQTAERAGFGLHQDQYYYDVFDRMGEYSVVTAAFVDDKPVAFLWLAISKTTAFELYGGMNEAGQQLRLNYALKWHTIQLMKKWGIERYDMNGLLNDGVSTFKQGFASHEDRLAGTFDRPLSPLYVVWNKGLPAAKKILQKIKNR